MQLNSIPVQTGNGSMKKYTSCKINLSVDSWPLKRKDIQLLIDEEFYVLPGGQSPTDKLVLQFVYIFIVSFPVWAGIKIYSSQNRKWNYENYTSCRISLSVDSWLPKRKDIQLLIQYLIRSCMSFLFGGQVSTDKLILQLVYIFIVPFPVWAGFNWNSISGLGWN